jgi:hypothetical protein
MRSFSSIRFVGAIGSAALLLGLMLPAQALAQAPYLKYTATGTVTGIVAANPASLPKLTTAGIAVGSAITTSIVIQRNTPDADPHADKATYGSHSVSWSLGDGPVTFDVSGMQRHSAMAIQNDRPSGEEGVPFAFDAFGWGGAEPTQTSGPSFLALQNWGWDPVEEKRVPKGTAVILVGGWAALPDTSIPESVNLGSYLLRITAMDLFDTELHTAITINGNVTSITVEELPTIPSMNGWAVAGLLLALLAAGSLLAARQLRVES